MITLLKLGGSLITDKNKPHTARPDVIHQLAREIKAYCNISINPLIIGHGSGSFGHMPAKKYGTRNGVHNKSEWQGFAEVHAEATALNFIVTDILREEGLPILSFVPMNCVRTNNGIISTWDTSLIMRALANNLIPVVFGDTVFDDTLGGTILSTEDLFVHLCSEFDEKPNILLAGLEEGVWRDYPKNTTLIREIDAAEADESFISGSASVDVTGGMREKVRLMKSLVREGKANEAVIFSGEIPGNLFKTLKGQETGTCIKN